MPRGISIETVDDIVRAVGHGTLNVTKILRGEVSRREFLWILATFGVTTVLGEKFIELLTDLYAVSPLPVEWQRILLAEAKQTLSRPEFGYIADLRTPNAESGWQAIEKFSQSVPLTRIATFSTTQEIFSLSKRTELEGIFRRAANQELVVDLRLGSGARKYHAFHPMHKNTVDKEFDEWALFLSLQPGLIEVSLNFETNLYSGSISHQQDGYIDEKVRVNEWGRQFREFYKKVIEPNSNRMKQVACFAAAGRSIGPLAEQIPDWMPIDLGLDIYDEPYGNLALKTWREQVTGEALLHHLHNFIVAEILELAASRPGSNLYIGEFSSDDPLWVGQLLDLAAPSMTGAAIFAINKQLVEKDFTPKNDVISAMSTVAQALLY